MVDYEELTLTLGDGYRAYARFFAAARPIGAVLYLHGIQSHCGWYESSARALRDAGFAVLQPDRRGSGRNAEARGHASTAEQLISDVRIAREELCRRVASSRIHMLGVSWGGKLVAAAHASDPSSAASLTLVTPGLFPLIGVTPAEKFRIGMAMVTDPQRLFDIPLNDAELFTADAGRQRFIREDALALRQATAGFYLASRRLDRVWSKLGAATPCPVHLLLAEDERIIDNARTAEFVRALHWPQTRITTYQGARHSLEFEPTPHPYADDLVGALRSFRARCEAERS